MGRFFFLIVLATLSGAATTACASQHPPLPQTPSSQTLEGQPLGDQDHAAVVEAIARMDGGQPEKAIPILEQVRSRHPNSAGVLHELALAYRLAKQPAKAVDVLWPFRAQLPVETLASLTSALDDANRTDEAIALLKSAITAHPHAGLLYSELATTLLRGGKQNEAAQLYERGIEEQPELPANYVHLAMLLSESDHRGLSILYGETFRLLEPDTERSTEVAKMMARVCQEALTFNANGSVTVKLGPKIIDASIDKSSGQLLMPVVSRFELEFGPGLALVATRAPRHQLDLAALHTVRDLFLRKENDSDFSSVPVVAWLRQLNKAGHLEAYDYWLFGPAFAEQSARWARLHRGQWAEMQEYLSQHPLFAANDSPR
jgi:tetratricopeptide (TPR) repeat protein